ncbi:MAG: tail protein X [Oceanospirillaceae bacterium]|nr:tail protein X [Oceanospirillaceae bacterium]
MQYRSRQGETLDLICYRHYGTSHLTTEIVMQANPELAEQGLIIVENTLLELPQITSTTPVNNTLQLWD